MNNIEIIQVGKNAKCMNKGIMITNNNIITTTGETEGIIEGKIEEDNTAMKTENTTIVIKEDITIKIIIIEIGEIINLIVISNDNKEIKGILEEIIETIHQLTMKIIGKIIKSSRIEETKDQYKDKIIIIEIKGKEIIEVNLMRGKEDLITIIKTTGINIIRNRVIKEEVGEVEAITIKGQGVFIIRKIIEGKVVMNMRMKKTIIMKEISNSGRRQILKKMKGKEETMIGTGTITKTKAE
jgi:hypothetical protein